ncbi:MAG TPA: hypothetical protein VGN57_23305 [Pirellulaceae bacterium]|jgi:hypothetical protein|nr:hypothetical protein [Pirellulaceae bacterium]
MLPDALERWFRVHEDARDARQVRFRANAHSISPNLLAATRHPVRAVAATLTALLFAVVIGCSPAPADPQPRPPAPPIVEESYAVDDENRPLTEAELDAAFARLQSDEAAFLAELEKAPPVRQASLIFVLQRSPAVARQHRALLEQLSTSLHGIVRRAALFALEAVEEEPAAAVP